MKIIIFISALLTLPLIIYAQEDSIIDTGKSIRLHEVVVTATKTLRHKKDIPAKVDIVDAKEIKSMVVNNTDEILRSVANINVNRSWGVYSKNASVTMRGLESSARTLILLDGIPLNKSAGGSVNWHMISPDEISRIEVVKGPGSALHGNNAMAGVINIITDKNIDSLTAVLSANYGTFNTKTTRLLVGDNYRNNNKGAYWSFNGFYRNGDGYINEPIETRNASHSNLYLTEYSLRGKVGYQLNEFNKIEFSHTYFDDVRGEGRKVFEDSGSYLKYKTNLSSIKYIGGNKDYKISASIYYRLENYYSTKERLNSYSEYKLYETFSDKEDNGLMFNVSKKIFKNNTVTTGIEYKRATANFEDIYRTSPDVLSYNGELSFYSLFVQDEIKVTNKILIVAGVRGDYIEFSNGNLTVENPTKNTGFVDKYINDFSDNNWTSINPKISSQYAFSDTKKLYISVARGVVAPKLDDMCRSGKITKGFKIANPHLKPEYLTNFEVGSNSRYGKLNIENAIYYSIGKDMIYMVANGDSVDTGGDAPKPEISKQNVSEVEIIGAEISLRYRFNDNLVMNSSYSYNHSIINNFNTKEDATNDLTGNYLMEVAPHMAYCGITYLNRFIDASISYNYMDKQWINDINTEQVESYSLINFKLSKEFRTKYYCYLDIQNILDNEYVDRKGRLSPGRFITIGLKIKLI